ncbi:MAG: thiamine pyrophosphate-dependent enzyme [Alphaproteobacteria bacterium]|jgi:phosphonopyruvate decarboxylase|nr:thiamine pyrophosphate-dependent enzyme [Alphaproteobacteria bacterium]
MSAADSGSNANSGTLDRGVAVPKLLGDLDDFLIVTGLAGTARDVAAMAEDKSNVFYLAGAMGGAVAMGLGLALAQPERKVLVVTGDGELLMNVGTLAAVAVRDPANLSIVCVDNGHYGETGFQLSHTSLGTDLEAMAVGAGIKTSRTVTKDSEIAEASSLIRQSNGTSFVLLKVGTEVSPRIKRSLDAARNKVLFREALLG